MQNWAFIVPIPKDKCYIAINRLVVLPFITLLILMVTSTSSSIVWDFDKFTLGNTLVAFVVIFALSDLAYYIGHRLVHSSPLLFRLIHRHHPQERAPMRGWLDTSNATPVDFFYTGVLTSPLSVMWLMPANSVHIVTLVVLLYSVLFVGALGHSRVNIDVLVFNTRMHAGHHHSARTNYAQNVEVWDKLFGTFQKYPNATALNLHRPLTPQISAQNTVASAQ